ncbi:MAG: ferrous iron transport protein B, partial [Leptospiraceae bacterium]|nr:ferrous iron transport protein B [Leptospiraceae bacterium]
MANKDYRLLIVGNPNCGKSTLFNKLTGLNQKTGNFSGVTVEKKMGTINWKDESLEIIDLPGSHSLNGTSEDKVALTRFLMKREPKDKIIYVMDATQIERSMQFLFQIIDLGIPVILALTMKDILKRRNISLDLENLKKELGINAEIINAKTGEGVNNLNELLFVESNFKNPGRLWKWEKKEESIVNNILNKIQSPEKTHTEFVILNSLKKLSGEKLQKELPDISIFPEEVQKFIEEEFFKSKLKFKYQEELIHKSFKIKEIIAKVLTSSESSEKSRISTKLDSILLHPLWGMFCFLLLMGIVFQSLFTLAEFPMDLIDDGFDSLSALLSDKLPSGPLTGLIAEGAIKGVGAVMVFIPQIALLFFFIGLMEESGYMARASFVMDKFMGRFGLSGKSFIPLLSSAACAVPSILGARSIDDKSDRMRTIMVSPLITCSARYPVYILVIGAIFPEVTYLGIFTLKAIIMFGLFILGMLTALVFALLFKKTFFKEDSSYFILELPGYKIPTLRNVLYNVYLKVKDFVVNSGQIILLASIVLWFLVNYPYKEISPGTEAKETVIKEQRIKESYAASIGKFIEPVIEPLGFDWKIGISLITSFAAREVMVSTLAIIYGVETDEPSSDLEQAMKKDINPKTGKPVWSVLTSISVLLFFAYACQCMSTLAVVRKETNSYFWPAFMFAYMGILAYISSLLVYQIG